MRCFGQLLMIIKIFYASGDIFAVNSCLYIVKMMWYYYSMPSVLSFTLVYEDGSVLVKVGRVE